MNLLLDQNDSVSLGNAHYDDYPSVFYSVYDVLGFRIAPLEPNYVFYRTHMVLDRTSRP